MLRFLATSGVLAFALSGTAFAQTAPAAPAAPAPSAARAAFAERAATMALRGAYRTIAAAEVRGASGYLDAAKNHYRGALARLARHDAGAASEAMAAAALARAATAEHPLPAPRDIPPPPALVAAAHPAMTMPRPPVAMGGNRGDAQMRRPGMGCNCGMHRGHGMSGRFDATRLAADAKLANSPETRDLAQKALDADIARTRASFAGNADEAMRQGRLASDLAMAVRSLALADHPRTFMRRPGMPGGMRRTPAAATVGYDTDDTGN